uniref:DUF8207 domain-containing protein n=1 Tax=Cacopsylla melanoneura TaxID=428564 RepID=A0A8D9EKD8_9HEMI
MTLTSFGALFEESPNDPLLERVKGVIEQHLPEGWKNWMVNAEGLILPIRESLRNKIRFAIPTVELFNAVLPKETRISEKSYRKLYAALLNWPLGKALIYSPSEVVQSIHSGDDLVKFVGAVEQFKGQLLSRSELNSVLKSPGSILSEVESPAYERHPSPRASQHDNLPERVGSLERKIDSIQESLVNISTARQNIQQSVRDRFELLSPSTSFQKDRNIRKLKLDHLSLTPRKNSLAWDSYQDKYNNSSPLISSTPQIESKLSTPETTSEDEDYQSTKDEMDEEEATNEDDETEHTVVDAEKFNENRDIEYYLSLLTRNHSKIDKVGGVKVLGGKFFIGSTPVLFDSAAVHPSLKIKEKKFRLTNGLNELLFMKQPDEGGISSLDERNYRDIVKLAGINVAKAIEKISHTTKQEKYLSGKGILMTDSRNTKDYVFWDDPNELVQRLHLLHASRSAGHSGHNNEIISIVEELREAGYIY